MLVCGIDPGSRVTGYGFVSAHGTRLECVDFGVIKATRGSPDFPERLCRIYNGLVARIDTHQPVAVAVEGIFNAVNTRTALKLGQARGVALLAAGIHQIPVFEYSPRQVKKSVCGYGQAEKSQVQLMVRTLLNLQALPQPHDAADALAVAICHVFNQPRLLHSQQH